MSIWYPYTQHETMSDPLAVAHASGALLTLSDGRTLIDGIASWWCVIHGYNHPRLNNAIQAQLEQFSHSMLGGLTHAPAITLADKLVAISPPDLEHVFFSDSGSVGVEVALKMAIQYWRNKGLPKKYRVITLQYAYHGDTIGAMSVSDPIESMHPLFSPLLSPQIVIPSPCHNSDLSLQTLHAQLKENAAHIAALIVEPLVQGAGGFKFYDPKFLTQAKKLCQDYEVLLIADEIATGFGRTGTWFACDQAEISPDIMIVGKGLTGGYLGHAATLATDEIFQAFSDPDPSKAFMHGPTFMGNALAMAVSLESIALLEEDPTFEKVKKIESICKDELDSFSHPLVTNTRVKGAIGVIEVTDATILDGIQAYAVARGVWLRPFGNVVYVMPPYIISEHQLRYSLEVIKSWFRK